MDAKKRSPLPLNKLEAIQDFPWRAFPTRGRRPEEVQLGRESRRRALPQIRSGVCSIRLRACYCWVRVSISIGGAGYCRSRRDGVDKFIRSRVESFLVVFRAEIIGRTLKDGFRRVLGINVHSAHRAKRMLGSRDRRSSVALVGIGIHPAF